MHDNFYGRDWVDAHLEEFIKPNLGKIPTLDLNALPSYLKSYSTPKIAKSVQALWKQGVIKAKGRPILLAGRDVFLFELIARVNGFYTVFRPEISSPVSARLGVQSKYKDHFLLDTGFKGTVPKNLGIENFALISYDPYPKPVNWQAVKSQHQIFPTQKSSLANIAGIMESIPKYWTSGHWDYAKKTAKQAVQKGTFFEQAAMITLFHLAHLKIPKRKRHIQSPGRLV